jgi:hypothetical protein
LIGTSDFLKFRNRAEQKAFKISKMFIFQLINTALILIMVNAKMPFFDLPAGFPLFNGKYDDFTVQWYRAVGLTLHFTMITQVFVPPLVDSFKKLVPVLKRWRDRGFKGDPRVTKQVLQEEYEELYTGEEFPIEQRYGSVLRTFYVTMMVSSGMPAFYLISFFEMLVMYECDKLWCKLFTLLNSLNILVLKYYRTPPRYGVELSEKVINLMQYAVLLHLPFGFLMFSYTQIFTDNSSLASLAASLKSKMPSIVQTMFLTS